MKHLLICIALLCLLPPPNASARSHRRKIDASSGLVTAVSGGSISVKSSKKSQTYKISSVTVIHLDAQRVDPSKLKKGMRAQVTPSEIDQNTAISIEATTGS
jgi:hypothetical protein